MTQQYLTVAEITAVLRVNRSTVHRWIKDGRLPALTIAGVTRIDTKDFKTFIREHTVDPDPIADELADYFRQRDTDRTHPLCPHCTTRETDPTSTYGWCGPCTRERDDERRDRELESKRRWWNEHGNEWRNQRKEKTNAT